MRGRVGRQVRQKPNRQTLGCLGQRCECIFSFATRAAHGVGAWSGRGGGWRADGRVGLAKQRKTCCSSSLQLRAAPGRKGLEGPARSCQGHTQHKVGETQNVRPKLLNPVPQRAGSAQSVLTVAERPTSKPPPTRPPSKPTRRHHGRERAHKQVGSCPLEVSRRPRARIPRPRMPRHDRRACELGMRCIALAPTSCPPRCGLPPTREPQLL